MKPIILISCSLILASCTSPGDVITNVRPDKSNPASVFCYEKNGKLSLVKTKEGVTGYCTLPSGELIDEWELYRREHSTY